MIIIKNQRVLFKKNVLLLIIVISINSYSEEVKYKKIEKVNLELESNDKVKTFDYNVKVPNDDVDISKKKEEFDYYRKKGEESPPFETLSFVEKIVVSIASWFVEPKVYKNIKEKDNSKLNEKLGLSKKVCK